MNKDQSTKSSYSGWSKRCVLAESQVSKKADTATGTMIKHKILQTTPKVLEWKGKKRLKEGRKNRGGRCGCAGHKGERLGTDECEEKRLWELHRLANNRKGSLSSACKKNSEANNKVYDLKQRTVAALDRLAEVYETFRGHVGHRGKGVRCRRHVVRFRGGRGDMAVLAQNSVTTGLSVGQHGSM